jgi:hypothetical protein
MNYAGFIPTGLLFLAFATSISRLIRRSRLSTLATTLLVFFAAGVITAGLASCDVGCPQGTGSLSNLIHNSVSPLAFLALILASALLGLHFRNVPEWRSFWLYSIVTSSVALAFMVVLVASMETRSLTGLWQRLFLTTLFIWSTAVSLRLRRLLTSDEVSKGFAV